MKDFYDEHYSSNLMTLCLHSNQEIDDMEAMAKDLFKNIPNKNIKAKTYGHPLQPCYGGDVCPKMTKICPVSNTQEMKITWYMPYLGYEIRKVHYDYFHELFGHEGQNSILSYLRDNDLGMGVTIKRNEVIKQMTMFEMVIDLTDKGLENVP